MFCKIFTLLSLFLFLHVGNLYAASTGEKPLPLPREKLIIRDQENPKGKPRAAFYIEVAQTREAQQRGLMNRTELPKNKGMLFVFDPPVGVQFWMKDTLVPLDMIFIDPSGKIQKIYDRAEPQDEANISSGGVVSAVLEILGGEAEARGIKVGDQVTSPTLKKLLVK